MIFLKNISLITKKQKLILQLSIFIQKSDISAEILCFANILFMQIVYYWFWNNSTISINQNTV